MQARYIVPVEPASSDNGDGSNTVIIEVSQEGPLPLDLRLVGCEGENPYVTHIKHANIADLQHKFKGTGQEWEAILSHFLLHETNFVQDVRFVYSLQSDAIKLSFQQHIKGIKATLGEILLPRDDAEELNPFEWAQASAQHHRQTLDELAKLKSGASNEQQTVQKLQTQLDDFIKTKNDTEREMLQQFMQLLNEKKRKIRDQSRLLAGAKIDEDKAKTVTSARESAKPRKTTASRTTASRTSKRKAGVQASEPEPEPEPELANDDMELDVGKVKEDDSESGVDTPDRLSDVETEEEDAPPEPVKDDVSVPARRELPFARRAAREAMSPSPAPTTRAAAAAAAAAADGDETEDEEL